MLQRANNRANEINKMPKYSRDKVRIGKFGKWFILVTDKSVDFASKVRLRS